MRHQLATALPSGACVLPADVPGEWVVLTPDGSPLRGPDGRGGYGAVGFADHEAAAGVAELLGRVG
jgi:hypothetical protein